MKYASSFVVRTSMSRLCASLCPSSLPTLPPSRPLKTLPPLPRWGMHDAFGDNHDTADVCLGEIERCVAQSAGIAFAFLSGERYGCVRGARTGGRRSFGQLRG